MDDLFRWMTVRPAQSADANATIALTGPPVAPAPAPRPDVPPVPPQGLNVAQPASPTVATLPGTTPVAPSVIQPPSVTALAPADSTAAVDAVGSSFQADLLAARNSTSAPGTDPWQRMVALARAYQLGPREGVPWSRFANPPSSIQRVDGDHRPFLQTFADRLRAFMAGPRPAGDVVAALDRLVQNVFDVPAARVVNNLAFQSDWMAIDDSILALFITPAAGRGLLGALTEMARMIDLIRRVADGDATLAAPASGDWFQPLAEALQRTLLLPEPLFPINPGLVKPAGVADLLVARQHLTRYELGDVASIENLLRGEYKAHKTRHALTTEHDTTTETEKTTVTEQEVQTDERFGLKTESERVIKEDLNLKAGIDASYKYGSTLTVNANAEVAYDQAKSDSVKASSDFAKDVTSRAATKVTERVLTRETRKVTETFERIDEHGFFKEGAAAPNNVIGVYQWVNKVYTAQVFNYGKRLLFDISIPEPAAFLLAVVASPPPAEVGAPLVEPDAVTLRPSDLDVDNPFISNQGNPPQLNVPNPRYYGSLFAKYGVSGFDEPRPMDHVTVAKSIQLQGIDEDHSKNLISGVELAIPDGYQAQSIMVNGDYFFKQFGFGAWISVTVGGYQFTCSDFAPVSNDPHSGWVTGRGFRQWSPNPYGPAHGPPPYGFQSITDPALMEATSIPVAVCTHDAVDCSVVVEVFCKLRTSALENWKLKAHAAIVQAYNKQLADYRDQLAQSAFQQQAAPLMGENPDYNRQIERTELKRAAVQILSGRELVSNGFDAVREGRPASLPPDRARPFPRADLARAQEQARFIRFFEQAFEWEQMTYVFYPYLWGRTRTWYDQALQQNDDPQFADFLGAGSARAVIPVRPGFEADIWYFLVTSQVWGGGDLPAISDKDYLPITEEIKDATGAPGTETPEGDSWEVRVPTQLVRVRKRDPQDRLPSWTRTGDWTWTGTPET